MYRNIIIHIHKYVHTLVYNVSVHYVFTVIQVRAFTRVYIAIAQQQVA